MILATFFSRNHDHLQDVLAVDQFAASKSHNKGLENLQAKEETLDTHVFIHEGTP